jgi:hypothetical protein
VGGTPGGVRAALLQARHQDVAGTGGHGEERVTTVDVGVAVVAG